MKWMSHVHAEVESATTRYNGQLTVALLNRQWSSSLCLSKTCSEDARLRKFNCKASVIITFSFRVTST
jgi:hypothetical protein